MEAKVRNFVHFSYRASSLKLSSELNCKSEKSSLSCLESLKPVSSRQAHFIYTLPKQLPLNHKLRLKILTNLLTGKETASKQAFAAKNFLINNFSIFVLESS